MKISELILKLEETKKEKGDLEVAVRDGDESYPPLIPWRLGHFFKTDACFLEGLDLEDEDFIMDIILEEDEELEEYEITKEMIEKKRREFPINAIILN